MPDDPSQDFEEQDGRGRDHITFIDPNGIPLTVRAAVRAWRIHFEHGINADQLEDDIIRVLCDLLMINNSDQIWPTFAETLQRWEVIVATEGS